MYRKLWRYTILIFFLVVVVTTVLAQTSTDPQEIVQCTAEDYEIFRAALDYFAGIRKPDRLLLRDRTYTEIFTRSKITPFDYGEQGATRKSFEYRNSAHSKIDVRLLKGRREIVLIDPATEQKVLQTSSSCNDKEPFIFISLPGVNNDHSLAVILVGRTCSRTEEFRELLLLEKKDTNWKVLHPLMHSNATIDYF